VKGAIGDLFERLTAEMDRTAPSTPRPPLPLGAPARSIAAMAELRAADRTLGMRRQAAPIPPCPIVLTDWSARLASDWTHVDARHDNLADATAREFTRLSAGAEYAPRVLFAPLLSELTELKAVTLVNWRQALRVHAEDELALYGAKAEVA
jgi:hypothetical protein